MGDKVGKQFQISRKKKKKVFKKERKDDDKKIYNGFKNDANKLIIVNVEVTRSPRSTSVCFWCSNYC